MAAPKGDSSSYNDATMANITLAISVLATLICLLQVIQQFAAAGSPLRLCDSIVYGGRRGLPGQGLVPALMAAFSISRLTVSGRRVWVWKQFRYRIIYEIPRISLAPLNPSLGAFVPYLIKPSPSFDWPAPEQKLMSQLRTFDTTQCTGEAAWVSFSRVLLQVCPGSVIVNRVQGDADRCPLDMTVIPMPVAMRDMAFFALAMGMECVDASFAAQCMTMRGQSGAITSSQHPLLGAVLHYAPPQDGFKIDRIGVKMDPAWILRVCGRVRVGSIMLIIGKPARIRSDNDKQQPGDYSSDESQDFAEAIGRVDVYDSSETSSEDEKISTAQAPYRSDTLRPLEVPRLDWYWLSQLPVIPGFWATPFRRHVKLDICWGAQTVVLRALYSLFAHDTIEDLPPVKTSSLANFEVTCGSNTTSFPPYGITRTGEPMSRNTIEGFAKRFEFIDSATFDCDIPKIEIRKASLLPSAHAVLDDHRQCTIDVMSLDVWLYIVGKTERIWAGLGLVTRHVPSIVMDVMNTMGPEFAEASNQSDGKSLEGAVLKLRDAIRSSGLARCGVGLSGAEQMYVLVALLRTAKVGLCIGLGNDTSCLMEIIEKDIQVHLL